MWRIRIEGEGFGSIRKEEESAGSHPANPENIKPEVEPFLQETVAIGMHKVLEGENEAKSAGDEEDGADEVGYFFGGMFSQEVEGGYDG